VGGELCLVFLERASPARLVVFQPPLQEAVDHCKSSSLGHRVPSPPYSNSLFRTEKAG